MSSCVRPAGAYSSFSQGGAIRDPGDRVQVEAVVVGEDAARPDRRGREPALQPDAPAVEIGRRADAAARVHIDVGMAEHALDEDRDRGEAQRPERQVGDVTADVEFGDVERAARGLRLTRIVVRVHGDGEGDALGLHRAVDQCPAAVVWTAGHREVQRHVQPSGSNHSLRSPAGLTRGSIASQTGLLRRRWIAGSPARLRASSDALCPAMTQN
jgi:hypothetical protein